MTRRRKKPKASGNESHKSEPEEKRHRTFGCLHPLGIAMEIVTGRYLEPSDHLADVSGDGGFGSFL